MAVILRISKNSKKNKDGSFRAVLIEFLLNFVGFFLPVCKVALLCCLSGRFSVIKLVKESQMNLSFAYADVRAILAVSKDGYSGHSGTIIPINFPPESGVFKSYVFPVYFSRQFASVFKRQAVPFLSLASTRKRFPLEQIINVNHFFFTANTATPYIIIPGSVRWLDNGPIAKFRPNSYVTLSHKNWLSTSARR